MIKTVQNFKISVKTLEKQMKPESLQTLKTYGLLRYLAFKAIIKIKTSGKVKPR